MATKDHCLFFKNKQDLVVSDKLNNQFNNLNLNQNNQCFSGIIQSENVEKHKKEILNYGKTNNRTVALSTSLGYSHYNDSQAKQKSFGNPKLSSSFANPNIHCFKNKESKEGKTLNANSSTLSLHITAYENSMVATSGDSIDGAKAEINKKKENTSSIKKWRLVEPLNNSFSTYVNYAFELPRQQQVQNNDPEVMQFKASQRLPNVNGVPSLSNVEYANITETKAEDDDGDGDENKADTELNAQTYSSTNRMLIGLIFQIICVISASFPVIYALYKFLRFEFIADGFWLEIGPVMAIGLSLTFSLMASVWQFSNILSFRSIPLAMKHSKNGFLSTLIVGLLLFSQYLLFSIILFSTNSNWEEPIKKNFGVLLEAAPGNVEAAEELNVLQLRFGCCGLTPSQPSNLPSRFASFQPFFKNFHPHHINSVLHKTQNLPFSCCKCATPSIHCFHLNLEPTINQNLKFQTFPPSSYDRSAALSTLNYETCPEKIFDSIKWQLFIYPAISFLVVGIICLLNSIYGGYSLWSLRKLAESNNKNESQKSIIKSDIQEMPKAEDAVTIPIDGNQNPPADTTIENQKTLVAAAATENQALPVAAENQIPPVANV